MAADEPVAYARSWALDDIHILRAADGHSDGRTVEAYAAVFDTPTEITDQHGHYMEKIARTAFNRTLSHGIDRVGVFYNHALTMHGTPASGEGSVPIGSPVDIRADDRGLRTVTRFNRSSTIRVTFPSGSVVAATRPTASTKRCDAFPSGSVTDTRSPRSYGMSSRSSTAWAAFLLARSPCQSCPTSQRW